MKNIIKAVFSGFGLEIKRASNLIERRANTHIKHEIDFIQDKKFQVDFTHLTLAGDQYFVPKYALHRPAASNLIDGTLYEPDTHELISHFCKAFKGSIVHAGTFFGDMIPSFSNSVSGNVYAFEPVFQNYVLAKLCVDNNGLSNVILMNTALSDRLGNLFISTGQSDGKHAGGNSTISDDGEICVAINIDRLNIDDLILIQLDVEGHELIALTGAKETINKYRPLIAIEDNNNECAEYLNSLRYDSIGQIPGLTIWAPIENNQYKESVLSFLGLNSASTI